MMEVSIDIFPFPLRRLGKLGKKLVKSCQAFVIQRFERKTMPGVFEDEA